MKPSPLNIQELYLESLARLGIKAAEHDIRFVEDNWESPTLGAWGLGWGSMAGWNGKSPSSLIFNKLAALMSKTGFRGNHLWVGASVPCNIQGKEKRFLMSNGSME